MKINLLLLFIVAVHVVGFTQSVSRTVYASSGSELSNGNLVMNFTIGEPITSYFANTDISFSQGFQQGDQRGLGFNELDNNPISIYPNPSNDVVNIKGLKAGISYHLTDILGRKLMTGITSEEMVLNLGNYSTGKYLLVLPELNKSLSIIIH